MGILFQIQMRAEKMGMQGTPKDQLPKMSQVMKEYGHLALPDHLPRLHAVLLRKDGYHGCVLYDRIHDHRGAVQKEYENDLPGYSLMRW